MVESELKRWRQDKGHTAPWQAPIQCSDSRDRRTGRDKKIGDEGATELAVPIRRLACLRSLALQYDPEPRQLSAPASERVLE